ncbi:MAG: hypothetical protein LUH18_06320 [Oscillospiraceae bacterium]|nr:hypothetical protein [Oscillospiraceae bacterium]
MKNKLQGLVTIAVIAILVLSLIYIDEVKETIVKSIENCIIGIVPSLFLNSVLASVLIKCSESLIPKRISPVRCEIFLVFLLGNICGYPIGAKMLSELVKENRITSEQAEKVICFSYASGPAYILGIVSSAVFHVKLLGFTAFLSIFLSNTILYILFIVKFKVKSTVNTACKGISLTSTVMDAINSSANSMISICSAIVFFSALLSLLPLQNPIVSAILEISNITSLQGNGLAFFVLVTVLLSFGGLCVHMQIICLSGGNYSFKWFYITRPIQLFLTAIISTIGYLIVQNHISIETGVSSSIELSSTGSVIPFVCISGMVLITLTYRKQKSDR